MELATPDKRDKLRAFEEVKRQLQINFESATPVRASGLSGSVRVTPMMEEFERLQMLSSIKKVAASD